MSAACNTPQVGGRFDGRRSGRCTAAALLGMAAAMALSGCSSSTTKPQVVSILVTDAYGNTVNPQPSSVTVDAGIYLDATVSNDGSNLGADWTVSCGSAPAPGTPLPPGVTVDDSCGTFTPVHTMSGPVPSYATSGSGYVTLYTPPAAPPKGGTVTLFAAATVDPSRFAALTLTVTGLPISIGFAPQPPATLAVNGTTPLKAVVSNDYVAGGVSWSVTCKSSACGTISPAQTASGAATTYTAPGAPPTGGTVTVTATSVTDSTKSVSATITIAPITVTVVPATLSVATGATGLLNATVAYDVSNAGVDWTLACGTAGECGSITAHTASGAPATYTAPAAVPAGGTVTVTAASSANNAVSGVSVVTVTPANASASGSVGVGRLPVAGARVSLYAAGEDGYGSASRLLSAENAVLTGADGSFTVQAEAACPSPASLLYVAASGGEADGSALNGVILAAALGPCGQFATGSGAAGAITAGAITVNEVTTVAAAYALSPFATDAAHIGSSSANYKGIAAAFAMARDLADITSGEARAATLAGGAAVPRSEINSLADAVHRCLLADDGSQDAAACAAAFAVPFGASPAQGLQGLLAVARNAAASGGSARSKTLYELSEGNGPFQPSLQEQPKDWMIQLSFAARPEASLTSAMSPDRVADGSGREWTAGGGRPELIDKLSTGLVPAAEAAGSFNLGVDRSGNLWMSDGGDLNWSEFVGAASPLASAPAAAASAGPAGSQR